MTFSVGEAIGAGGAVLIASGVIVAAWKQIKKHGRADLEVEVSEGIADDANRQADALAAPPLSGRQQLDALDRVRDD